VFADKDKTSDWLVSDTTNSSLDSLLASKFSTGFRGAMAVV
jgi:hypothetical protein